MSDLPYDVQLSNVPHTVKDAIILSDMIASMLSKIEYYNVVTLELVVNHITSPSFSSDDNTVEIINAIAKHITEMANE